MTRPHNFPERKRQRRIRALGRIKARTAGKPEMGITSRDNAPEIAVLVERTANPMRDVRTKKDRSNRAAFARRG